ncbi:MAG: hypothetical protein ABI647_02955 [Gemmatimonadota bacterium]
MTLETLATVALAVAGAPQQHPAPVDQKLGTVRFATSCSAPVQPIFNRAVAFLHSFAFSMASDGFNAVLSADPKCAIAAWGIALSAWGNPFAAGIKPPAQIQRGLDAVRRARDIGPSTDRESAYVEAAARLYEHAESTDQRTRLLAYRDAMADLSARQPADTEAAIFHALALAISADPADKTYAGQLAAGATLEKLFAKLPDHPGLAHYIIHSYDVPPLADRALAAARRYSRIAPEVSHALHMPSHTYTRVGDWQRSIDANVAAAASAAREGSTAEELHADDYRMYASLQTGRDRAAREIVAALPAIAARLDPNASGMGAPAAAGYFAIAAIPARYALERGAWAEAAQLEVRPSPVPFADATTYFARAIGAARVGDTAGARAALDALERIQESLVQRHEGYWSEQVGIQRAAGGAWLAFAQGRTDAALAEMSGAVERENRTEKNAITPGPLAPAEEQLGEMLLARHEPGRALAAFEATLRREPNRFRALAGAAKAASEAGDGAAAGKYYGQLLKLGSRADRPVRPELIEAAKVAGRSALSGRPPSGAR